MDYTKAAYYYAQHREKLLEPKEVLGVGVTIRSKPEGDAKPTYEILILASPPKDLATLYPGEAELQDQLRDMVRIRKPNLEPQGDGSQPMERSVPGLGPICDLNADFILLNAPAIHDLQPEVRSATATSKGFRLEKYPDIYVIHAQDDLVVTDEDGGRHVDWVKAFGLLRDDTGDCFDFVLFNVDRHADLPPFGNHSKAVHNTIRGIGHYEGHAFDEREKWGDTKTLQSVQCTWGDIGVRTTLHETAHRWCAYAVDALGPMHEDNLDVEQQPYHWGLRYDNDESCMDYDRMDWRQNGADAWYLVHHTNPLSFSNLDLYLMGFAPERELDDANCFDIVDAKQYTLYYVEPKVFTPKDIVELLGPREPPGSDEPQKLRQAFVFITTRDPESDEVMGLVERLDGVRQEHEYAFRQATGDRGRIHTSLDCGAELDPDPDDAEGAVQLSVVGEDLTEPVEETYTTVVQEGGHVKHKRRGMPNAQQQAPPQDPIVLAKVKIRNTTPIPVFVKLKAIADPGAGGQDSDAVYPNGADPIPPFNPADPATEIHYPFTAPIPLYIYQLVVSSRDIMGTPVHWVCTLSDDEPFPNYPQSVCIELTPDMEPLARGCWFWMLTNDDANELPTGQHLHTVVDGPHDGSPI